MVQGKCLGSLNVAAPVATNNCGILLSLRYCRIARFGGGAERVEEESDFLLFDKAAHLLDCLRRTVAVVEADQVDLAAVDAAHVVDHLEIGGLGFADHPVGGGWSAIGHGLADLDFRIGDAGRVSARAEPALAANAAAALDCRNERRVNMEFSSFVFLFSRRMRPAAAVNSNGAPGEASPRGEPGGGPQRARHPRRHRRHDQDQQQP